MNVRVVNERERGFGIIEGERGISSVHSCRFSHFLTPSFSIISDASHPRQFPRLRPFLFLFLSVCLFSLFLLLRPFSVPFRGYGRACSSPELIYYGARLERAPVMLTLLMGNNVCGTRVDKEKEREQETRVRVERVFFFFTPTDPINSPRVGAVRPRQMRKNSKMFAARRNVSCRSIELPCFNQVAYSFLFQFFSLVSRETISCMARYGYFSQLGCIISKFNLELLTE